MSSFRIIEKVKKMGAAGYLSKPFTPEELVGALNSIQTVPTSNSENTRKADYQSFIGREKTNFQVNA